MPLLDVVEQGAATTTCRDRLRQLLTHVDDVGSIDPDSLLGHVERTECPQGHNLHIRTLTRGLLKKSESGSLRLGPEGEDWLIVHGGPPATWGESGPRSAPPLRAWQREALDAWAAHGRFGVVEAVTGTGKSRVGVEAIREALKDDFDVVVVVPTVDLVEQWVRTLRNSGITDVGTNGLGYGASWMRQHVIVSTVQSLYLNPPQRADGKVLVVADECHRYGAPQWSKALSPTYRRRLGLTATFERNDEGIGVLARYFGGGPVYRIGFPEAIRTGVVARYDVKLAGVDLTPREHRTYADADERAKDARQRLLAAEFPAEPFGAFMTAVQQAAEDDSDPTVEDLARQYLKAFSERVDIMAGAARKLEVMRALAPAVDASKGALVFTRRKESAEELALVLKDEGVKAEPIHSDHTSTQRRERIAGLKTGRVRALVAPNVLDEGVDVPDVDLGVVMSGSKSRRQMIQRMGRVLRLKADGRKATFIVVYARGTAEDLSGADGQEGSLDLIVESADRVVDLRWDGSNLIEDPLLIRNVTSTAGEAAVTKTVETVPQTVDPSKIVGRARAESHLPDALCDVDPAKLPKMRKARKEYGGLGSQVSTPLTEVEVAVLDELVPATILIEGEALEAACDVFELGDLKFSEALRETRALFEQDLSYGATVSGGEDCYDVRGLLATWRINDAAAELLGVRANYNDEPDVEAVEREEAEPVLDDGGGGRRDDEPEAPATDVVNQLERLAALRHAGALSDAEFTAAKGKILY